MYTRYTCIYTIHIPLNTSKHPTYTIYTYTTRYMEADFLVCCGTGGCDINEAQYEAVGLMPSHAYSILAVELVQGGTFLVKLRNPWGHGEWNGDWSDASPCWTPDLKARLDVAEADDGIFFMALDDLRTYFSSLDVCRYVERREEREMNLPALCVRVCVCVCMCGVRRKSCKQISFPFLLHSPSFFLFFLSQVPPRVARSAAHSDGSS